MLDKLKSKINKMATEEGQMARRHIDISVLSGEQVKIYSKLIDRFRENIETIEQISRTNKNSLLQYIKERQKLKQESQKKQKEEDNDDSDNDDQQFSFSDDLAQIKQALKQINQQTEQILSLQTQIKKKVEEIQNQTPKTVSDEAFQNLNRELEALRKSQESNKDILTTLSQQNQLYSKQLRENNEKLKKVEKELNDSKTIINNLREEKTILLEMRNNDTNSQLPEVEALKQQITEYEKRISFEKTKVEQKQKEVQSLKKKLDEDRQSLEKIADELKDKQLKSKKFLDKYERSKIEIRKFREQKTEFIKQLNMEIAKLSEELAKQKNTNENLKTQLKTKNDEIEQLKSEVLKNEHRKIEMESCETQLLQVRNQFHEANLRLEKSKEDMKKLEETNLVLQNKRKQLLQALEKPINHEMRTLQKILKALDRLYKQYITVVFQEGNVVGFESKIMYIISNVQEIKEDLLL